MPALKNFVAVDWRSGKDAIYFFFKDLNKYSRFDIGDNQIPEGYPSNISHGNWGDFHAHAKNLRFGFTTTGHPSTISGSAGIGELDLDISWFFYYEGDTPMVCRYDQDQDKVSSMHRVKDSKWHPLLPYFDRIVAGTWWKLPNYPYLFRFLMNDGTFLELDFSFNSSRKVKHQAITNDSWPRLQPYKNRIITAVQNDRTFADSYYYIFLTNNEYIIYNIQENRALSGPHAVNDLSWPGLLRT